MTEWLAIVGGISIAAHVWIGCARAHAVWRRRKSALAAEAEAHAATRVRLAEANAELARLRLDADPAVQAVRRAAIDRGRRRDKPS